MNVLKRGTSGTGTMKLIHKYEVPTGRTVKYARFVCDYIPQKEEKHRTNRNTSLNRKGNSKRNIRNMDNEYDTYIRSTNRTDSKT